MRPRRLPSLCFLPLVFAVSQREGASQSTMSGQWFVYLSWWSDPDVWQPGNCVGTRRCGPWQLLEAQKDKEDAATSEDSLCSGALFNDCLSFPLTLVQISDTATQSQVFSKHMIVSSVTCLATQQLIMYYFTHSALTHLWITQRITS